MKPNLYWNIYKNLEEELLDLSKMIHIDDMQLAVYSIKIADLLLRTCSEIESISKELYYENVGETPEDRNLYFDTECIKLLVDEWSIDKKIVYVSCPNMFLTDSAEINLFPLQKASIRGKQDWKKAYQAIKHNRHQNLHQGNIRNLIHAMAALFLLNLYYRNDVYEFNTYLAANNDFDARCGSEIFSIKLHKLSKYVIGGSFIRNSDFDECTYLIRANPDSEKPFLDAAKKRGEKAVEIIRKAIGDRETIRKDEFNRISIDALRQTNSILNNTFEKIRFDAFVNKNQC